MFTPDGNSVLSPVGNRVSVFDLVKCVSAAAFIGFQYDTYILLYFLSNKSRTFPFEMRKNIAALALSPDGNVLLVIDDGT